jgi:Skp family chaperone for outer membrane proteins
MVNLNAMVDDLGIDCSLPVSADAYLAYLAAAANAAGSEVAGRAEDRGWELQIADRRSIQRLSTDRMQIHGPFSRERVLSCNDFCALLGGSGDFGMVLPQPQKLNYSCRFFHGGPIMTRYGIAISTVTILSLAYLLARAETDATREERDHAAGKGYAAPENLRIATVDIAALFKNNPRFDAKMKDLKKKVEAAEADLKEQGEKIAKLQQQLGAVPREETSLQQSATKVLTDSASLFNTRRSMEGEQFMREEGALYLDTMQEISNEISRCAARHNIDLVIKINRDPVDKNDRSDILRFINAPTPYVNPKLDITEEVQASLAAKQPDESK